MAGHRQQGRLYDSLSGIRDIDQHQDARLASTTSRTSNRITKMSVANFRNDVGLLTIDSPAFLNLFPPLAPLLLRSRSASSRASQMSPRGIAVIANRSAPTNSRVRPLKKAIDRSDPGSKRIVLPPRHQGVPESLRQTPHGRAIA